MFYGDKELYFTPREADLIAETEGRRAPRRREVINHPHRHQGGGGRVFLAILFLGLLVFGVKESLKVSNAGAAAQTQSMRPPAPHLARRRLHHRPSATRQQQTPTSRAAGDDRKTSRTSSSSRPAELPPLQDALPPGWHRTALARDTVLFANAWQGARVLGPIHANTELLTRSAPAGGSCSNEAPPPGPAGYVWHAAVLVSGTGWGYVCVAFPESFNPGARQQLPPSWIRRVYQGDGPAPLEYPNGQILPGTEVVMRHTGNTNRFFVMSADGLSWGFGYSQDVPPAAGTSQNTAALVER